MLVKARVANGVYFVSKTYGCSLEASSVLVVLDEGAAPHGGSDDFDMGDCVVVADEPPAKRAKSEEEGFF